MHTGHRKRRRPLLALVCVLVIVAAIGTATNVANASNPWFTLVINGKTFECKKARPGTIGPYTLVCRLEGTFRWYVCTFNPATREYDCNLPPGGDGDGTSSEASELEDGLNKDPPTLPSVEPGPDIRGYIATGRCFLTITVDVPQTSTSQTVQLAWGDGSTENVTVAAGSGTATFTRSHYYNEVAVEYVTGMRTDVFEVEAQIVGTTNTDSYIYLHEVETGPPATRAF